MAVIAFILDSMESHYLPSFRLAKDLRERGHTIYYLGLASAGAMVRREGFEWVPILEGLAPAGRPASTGAGAQDLFGLLVSGEALDGIVHRIRPDAILMLSIHYAEALPLHFSYRVPIVFLTTFCRPAGIARAEMIEGLIAQRLMDLKSEAMSAMLLKMSGTGFRFTSFRDLAEVLLRMPELVLMPREIELPEVPEEPQVHYLGTGIDPGRREEPFDWGTVDPGRPLVYCSLGSHGEIAGSVTRRFFTAVAGAAAADPGRQFVLSVGRAFDPAELEPVPANLFVSRWVPQLEVLRRAGLMVTHGGVGTAKECLLMGVPMVVMPLIRDQFEMAKRIVYHRLGLEGDAFQVTAESLGALILRVAADLSMKSRVAAMRERILVTDRSNRGVEVIEAAIARAPLHSRGLA